jgi:hypothetical protein
MYIIYAKNAIYSLLRRREVIAQNIRIVSLHFVSVGIKIIKNETNYLTQMYKLIVVKLTLFRSGKTDVLKVFQ